MDVRLFRVKATITLVNGSCMDVPFNVRGTSEANVRQKVTVDYIMRNVSDDWGMPIRNVTVLKVNELQRASS